MAPERRGAAVSAFASSFFLGQSAGVSLGGWWVGTLGTARFLAAGAAGVLGVALVFVAVRQRHRAAAAPAAPP
jgi:predicted MFS family arabinose efflux permease